MESSHELLLTLASIFMLGLISAALGKHSFLTRVTLLLLFGLLIGGNGLDLIPHGITESFGLVADMALVIASAVIVGPVFTRQALQNAGVKTGDGKGELLEEEGPCAPCR